MELRAAGKASSLFGFYLFLVIASFAVLLTMTSFDELELLSFGTHPKHFSCHEVSLIKNLFFIRLRNTEEYRFVALRQQEMDELA